MTRRPADYQIITTGLEMLRAGVWASNLPNRLMDEFGLTLERASELADRAIELYRKRGRLDTKPLDQKSEDQ